MSRPVEVAALDPQSRDAGAIAHYGDPLREQRVLATEVGLVDRGHREVIAVPGQERLSWLHNLTTQHLLDLTGPVGTETLVLSPHGHVEHHAQVLEDGATVWLDVEPRTAEPLLEFLTKMRFLTQVEPRDATAEFAVLSLLGPGTDAALAELGVAVPGEPDVLPVPGPKFPAGAVPPRPTARYAVTSRAAIVLQLHNLLDQEYETFGILGNAGLVGHPEERRFLSPGAPRAAWVGIELSF